MLKTTANLSNIYLENNIASENGGAIYMDTVSKYDDVITRHHLRT